MPIDFARYLNIRSATTPVLSPDGARVAFLSDITGSYQVWSAPVAGNDWPQQLSFFEDKVWELYGSSAAPHLIAVGDVGGNERQQFYLHHQLWWGRPGWTRRAPVDHGRRRHPPLWGL